MALDSELFNTDPYYDDYSDDKKFLRMLFRPGFAVQARELTQAQTILQKQIQRFGDNIFKDGSIVTESQVVHNEAQFFRVTGLTGYAGVSIADFQNLDIQVTGKNGVTVVDTLGSLSGSNVDAADILVCSAYKKGPTAFAIGDVITGILDDTTISATITGGTSVSDDYTGAPSILPAFGSATLIGLDDGVRYIKGFFVKHDRQHVTPFNVTGGTGGNRYRVFNDLDSTIKFDVTDDIITATDDESLNDPAFGSYNYAAPGADRYKIALTLTHTAYSATGDYILMQFENGDATFKVNYPEYNVLADTMARRTYDESGNYTVEDFPISVVDDETDETKLNVVVGKGKAYIFGYEFVNFANKVLSVDKARTQKEIDTRQSIPVVIGNEVNLTFNTTLTAAAVSDIDFNNYPKFFLSSGTANDAFVNVGSLRIGKLNLIGSESSANVYEFSLAAGYTAGAVRRLFYLGYTGPNQHIFTITNPPLTIAKTNYNAMLFPMASDVVAYAVSGIQSQRYKVQKSITKTLVAGTNTVTTNELGLADYDFNSANDLVVVSATGAEVSISASLTSSNQTIQFTTSSTGPSIIFATIDVNDTDTASTFHKRTKTATTTTSSVIMRSSGLEEYAYLGGNVDAYQIISVTGEVSGVTSSMTDRFYLDSGQTDEIYDWSKIVLKKQYFGQGITAVNVTYKRYARSGNEGPFVMDSYGTIGSMGATAYKDIPVYNFQSRSGKPVSLAGCYDFRRDRITPTSIGATATPSDYGITGSISQIDDLEVESEWSYFLPRTDKIVLARDKQFKIVTGTETEQALAPQDTEDAMTLATVFLNPYTKTAKDTSKFPVKNRRYTMKDVGGLDKRISRLEYYTTLSFAEKDAKNLEIKDANGLNKFKNGIFVDDFTSRSSSNYNSPDHICAVDPYRREIRPKFITKYLDLSLTGSIPAGLTQSSDGIITFNYTTETAVSQPFASKAVNVNPFNVFNFNGRLILSPASDDWIDTTTLPEVAINLQGQNDGLADVETADFGTTWNNWETNWTGSTIGVTEWNFNRQLSPYHTIQDSAGVWRTQAEYQRWAIQETSQTRTGEKIRVTPETVTRNIGSRIVDVSVVPFMRANTLTIQADGMKPTTRVYPFFDGVDVSAYCAVAGVTGAAIVSDTAGKVGYSSAVTFALPLGTFKTGEKIFRLIDDTNNNVANCNTTAEATYAAQGLLKTEADTVVSTRQLNIRRESVTEERVYNNLVTESAVRWIDPVAQSFFIDPLTYPSGIFVKSVTLYFKSASTTLPVSLQLRPTVNGYPSSSTIIPLSEVYKAAEDVNTSDDASVGTTFTFSSPIYLQPGEYAMAVLSNSDDYEIWVSEVGQTDTLTENRISAQPYAGSFFKSQNSSTWTAEQSLDLKFILTKCAFSSNSGSVSFSYNETSSGAELTGGYDSFVTNGANVFKLNSTFISPANTAVATTVNFNGAGDIAIENNQNYTFPSKKFIPAGNYVKSTFALSSTETAPLDVTPVLDTQRISGLYIQNIINDFNDDSNGKKNTYETLATVRGVTDSGNLSYTRYMTKKINLQEEFESESMDVYMSARLPLNSDIRVFMKSQAPSDNTTFENLPYEPLSLDSNYSIQYGSTVYGRPGGYVSSSDDDYIDLKFVRGSTAVARTSGMTGQTIFKNFQLKVVMYGDPDISVTPAFKDLKAIAT